MTTEIKHPLSCMPPELQAAHYIKQILELREQRDELLTACKALQMEARARNCGLRIADEAIARAQENQNKGLKENE